MSIPVMIYLAVVQLGLPAYFSYMIWRGTERDRFAWALKVLYSGAFLCYILLTGRWDWLSYYLAPLQLLLFALAVLASLRRVRALPGFARRDGKGWLQTGGAIAALLFFGALLGLAARGFFYPGPATRLAFPLRDGRYYVAHGGNNPLVNYHNVNRAQRYALDILELNGIGARARGVAPGAPEDYAIYGATIHSPCEGTVATAVDQFPDQRPPTSDPANPAGNHVVIACQGLKVVLAHMQRESVAVQAGDRVATGQPVGRVGNSGNTSEPHLHIHAVPADAADVLDAPGVPLVFEGTFPIRNMILFR